MEVGESRMSVKLMQPLIPASIILVVGIFQPWGLKSDVIFFILSLLCFSVGFFYMKKRINEHNKMNKACVVQQLIRHQRHDWLNHVQVIMGYQMMKQSKEMTNYLQKTIQTANTERKITDFAYPPLAAMLLTVQHDYPEWEWHLVLDEPFSFQNIAQEKQLFQLLQVFLPWFVQQAKKWMQIQFKLAQQNQQIILVFTCIAEDGDQSEHVLNVQEITNKLGRWSAVCRWSKTGQQFTIQIPV